MANQFPMGGGGSRPKLIITGNSGPGSLYEANDTLSIADDTLILESQKGDTPGWTPEGGGLTTAATFVATSTLVTPVRPLFRSGLAIIRGLSR